MPVREVAVESLAMLSDTLHLVEAVNGLDGLRLAKEHTPDAIFVDVMMPVMDGVTFVNQIRMIDRFRYVPIAVLTGFGNEGLCAEMLRAGADTFLTKPASPVVIMAAGHALLRLRQNYVDLQSKIDDLRKGVETMETMLASELGKEKAYDILDRAKIPIY